MAPQMSDPAGAQDPGGKSGEWGNELQFQQYSVAAQKQQVFHFTQLQITCMPFLLLMVKQTEKEINTGDFRVS